MGILRTDIWRTGILPCALPEILARGGVDGLPVTWLPDLGPFRFLADPFGVWRDDRLYLFAEVYDYRDRIGRIDVFVFDRAMRLLDARSALSEPWHLSYPVVIAEGDEIYLLPEAYRSGRLTLYRAVSFPDRWEKVPDFAFPEAAIDASPVRIDGRWWMFYSPSSGSAEDKQSLLHVAWADALRGPWHLHPGNPVRRDRRSARPGGTPILVDGRVVLPTQDCTGTYGGAIVPVTITELGPERFAARAGAPIVAAADWKPFTDGLHTLSAVGEVTLVDAKRISRSPRRIAIELDRLSRRRTGRGR